MGGMPWRRQCAWKRANLRREIEEFLAGQDKTLADVARTAGLKRQNIYATLNGFNNNPRTLNALRTLGVPEHLICDPKIIQPEPQTQEVTA